MCSPPPGLPAPPGAGASVSPAEPAGRAAERLTAAHHCGQADDGEHRDHGRGHRDPAAGRPGAPPPRTRDRTERAVGTGRADETGRARAGRAGRIRGADRTARVRGAGRAGRGPQAGADGGERERAVVDRRRRPAGGRVGGADERVQPVRVGVGRHSGPLSRAGSAAAPPVR